MQYETCTRNDRVDGVRLASRPHLDGAEAGVLFGSPGGSIATLTEELECVWGR
jgi:hypothetical protein